MKVVAVVGTYRKGHTIDTAVDQALCGAADAGADTEKIMLMDRHIEFCTNCRACTQTPGPMRGKCILNDEMGPILNTLEEADAYIFASPINFFSITAQMKRFVERLVCYSYWPWGTMPKSRTKTGTKKVLLITSSACPALIGRFAFRGVFKVLKAGAGCLGAGSVRTLYFGMSALHPDSILSNRDTRRAYDAGQKLTTYKK